MKRFPLAPLVQLRAHAVDERIAALRDRNTSVEQAKSARAVAEQREREHERSRRSISEAESSRLVEGCATAGDFALLAAYEVGAANIADGLAQQSATVQQRLERAERERGEAEQALAEARAEQRVIENEQARHSARQRALVESRAEEEALEVWGNRRLQG